MDQQTIFALGATVIVVLSLRYLIGGQAAKHYRKGRKEGFKVAEAMTTIQLAMAIERGPETADLLEAPHFVRGFWNAMTETFLKRVDRPC